MSPSGMCSSQSPFYLFGKSYSQGKRLLLQLFKGWQHHLVLVWLLYACLCAWGSRGWLLCLLGLSYGLWRLYSLGAGWHRQCLMMTCLVLTLWFVIQGIGRSSLGNTASVEAELESVRSYQVVIVPSQIQMNETSWRMVSRVVLANGQSIPVMVQVSRSLFDPSRSRLDQVFVLRGQVTLERPEGARNFGLFNYQQYLADRHIGACLRFKQVEAYWQAPWAGGLWEGVRQVLLAPLFSWKGEGPSWQTLVLKMVFNYQTAGFYQQAPNLSWLGISHFFAISGFHLVYLRRLIRETLLRMGVLVEWVGGIVSVFLLAYSALCGWPIGAVRVMLGWTLKGLCQRHQLPILTSLDYLSLVGLILLIWEPKLIVNLGYTLSFGLSVVMLACQSTMQHPRHWTWQHQFYCLVACLLFTWPLIVSGAHEWYPLQALSLLVLGWSFQTLLMPLALISALVLYLQSFLGLTSILDWLNLAYQYVLEQGQPLWNCLRWHLITGSLSGPYLVLFFSLLLLWLQRGWRAPWTTGLIVVGVYGFLFISKPYLHWQASVTILDVGQGDSLVYLPAWSQDAWLIDTGGRAPYHQTLKGPRFDMRYGDYNLIPALKAQGIGHLRGVLITHSDLDHIGSLARLCQEIEIEHLWVSRHSVEQAVWREIQPYIQGRTQIHILEAQHAYMIQEGMTFYTPPFNKGTEPNEASVATTLRMGRHQLLNLGDMSGVVEQTLLKCFPQIQADLLKCAHHGSRFSTSEELLSRIKPRCALISAGLHNTYHHPHPDTLQRLVEHQIPYYTTPSQGAIRIWWTDWGWEGVETALPSESVVHH